jgi:hypothetical protein
MFGFGVATGYGWMAEGWDFGSRCADWLWGPTILLLNWHRRGSFLGCKAAGA